MLDSVEAVIRYAASMRWKGSHPVVELVTTAYHTGVKLTEEAMKALETRLDRLSGLDKWFVDILSPDQELDPTMLSHDLEEAFAGSLG